jgi:hypothetical protein
MNFREFAASMLEKKAIAPEDVLSCRRLFFQDGIIDRAEAEMIFHMNRTCQPMPSEWDDFFVEAMLDHIVYQVEPCGFVLPEDAEWLIQNITQDGWVVQANTLELLIRILENARSAPPSLQSFALKQIQHAVLDGRGPLINNKTLNPHCLNETEVEMIRRILFAPAGDGPLGVTRAEAEILFEMADKMADKDNHPSWDDLFAKAICNYLMSACGHIMPIRSEALKRSEWLNSEAGMNWSSMTNSQLVTSEIANTVGGFFKKMFGRQTPSSSLEEAYRQKNLAYAEKMQEAQQLEDQEVRWVYERLMRDGTTSRAEQALLESLKIEHGRLPERLRSLLDEPEKAGLPMPENEEVA